VFGLAADDVEVGAASELPNSGTYRGHEGYLTWLGQWLDAWEEFTIDVLELEAVDDEHVIADVDQHGRGRGSGLPVTQRGLAYLARVRDGRIVRLFLYPDRTAALEAAGVG
jgi:ketosteroid isomerase-like protein